MRSPVYSAGELDEAGNARPAFLCPFFDTAWLFCGGLAVIRTSAPRPHFIASTGLNAELHQAVGRSPVLRGSGDFFICFPWINPKSTTGRPSPKAWRPRGTRRVGFTVALEQLLMASLIPCPTCQNSWEALLPDRMSGRRGRGNPRTFRLPERLLWCSRQMDHHLDSHGPHQGLLRLNA